MYACSATISEIPIAKDCVSGMEYNDTPLNFYQIKTFHTTKPF